VERESTTTLQEGLIKIGAKVVCYGLLVTFQIAEDAVFTDISQIVFVS
jgi:hypothetical protein